MSYKVIYHGSQVIVEKPKYHYEGSSKNNDYGLGFYCTTDVNMAKEWATKDSLNGFANKYEIDERGLNILDLTDKSKFTVLNWIAVLVHNRDFSDSEKRQYQRAFSYLEKFYIETENFDIVIGYRADDAYFRFPTMFIQNVLTLEKLEEIYLLGDFGRQYVLISEKAFTKIVFKDAIMAEPKYHELYLRRLDNAEKSYLELEELDRYAEGTRISDLMRKEYDQDN